MEPDDLLCSRNARPQKALIGRAQWKINKPPSPEKCERVWVDGMVSPVKGVKCKVKQWPWPLLPKAADAEHAETEHMPRLVHPFHDGIMGRRGA